jgi:hypothetical protein
MHTSHLTPGVAPGKWLALAGILMLALSAVGDDQSPRIVEGKARELAGVSSFFIVTNDPSCQRAFCEHLQDELPDVAVVERAEDADAIMVLSSSLEREVIFLPDSGSCTPCQAKEPTPPRRDIERRKVVLSVLIPTGVNEYRRIYSANASGAFGTNPDERVAIQFVKAWRKWDRKRGGQ